MISISKQNGHISYGIKNFICDTESDIQTLPIDCRAGSSAIVVENSAVYMINHNHEWVKLKESAKDMLIKSSTPQSQKQFKILVDDTGAITAQEVV